MLDLVVTLAVDAILECNKEHMELIHDFYSS